MKTNLFLTIALALCALAIQAQEKPQVKVDVSFNRQAAEVQEPGYELWIPTQGKTTNTFENNGLKFTFTAPEGQTPDYICRAGWSKTPMQNADNKAKNGRLTMDGMTLDANDNSWKDPFYGQFTLKIEGLPAGSHTLITYHNWWGDAAKSYAAPITIMCQGKTQTVMPTIGVAVAANVGIATIPLTVANEGGVVEVTFATSADNPGTAGDGQTTYFYMPVLNGFELNTVNVSAQAKEPYPNSGDTHFDGDSKTVDLKWTAAADNVKEHRLYLCTNDESQLTLEATLPKGSETYTLNDLYSMNTYYWRVDEVYEDNSVVEGQLWSFRPRQLAFPGAEGYGRYAIGGRGGVVYHVTNLKNDHNPGSLLYGLVDMEGPRTIVFDVSGIIDMGFGSQFVKPYATIAGQTAPGKGICIKSSNINIGSDVIARHVRFKRGLGVYGENTGNAMGMSGANHAIVDHCTAAWGTDETVSGRGAQNISFQYCVISEALGIAGHKNYADGTNHGYAATIDGRIGSWHHNLLVNCNGRNWSMGGGMDGQNRPIGGLDLFNNVCYNWNGRTTDGNCHAVNFVNNYYKMGPDTRRTELFIMDFELATDVADNRTNTGYVSGNIRENKNHTLSSDKKGDTYKATGYVPTDYEYLVNEPLFPSYATIHTAQDAMKIVTSYSGATMPVRDEHHVRNIRETLDGSWNYKGSKSGIRGEIDTEEDITEHADGKGWEAYPEEQRAADWDTDQDGMPNWWEKTIGSDPNTANNNDDPDHDGWTLLEDYLDFMAHPYIMLQPDASGTLDVKPYFAGFYGQNGKVVTPTYTVAPQGTLLTASVNGSVVTVNAAQQSGVGTILVTVNDGETTFTQRFGVAITTDATSAIRPQTSDANPIVRREFFTLDGRQVSQMQSHETYVMRTTDAEGRQQSVKIIKN